MITIENAFTSAFEAAQRGEIEAWVHEYLLTVGRNAPFSEGLRLAPRFWAGPLEAPLSDLICCCGPQPEMEYVVDQAAYNRHVDRMVESIRAGWQPAPLIASYDGGILSVRDGNHRHEALRRAGFRQYWTIVWFNDPKDRAEFNKDFA